jgi:hypothetical protein
LITDADSGNIQTTNPLCEMAGATPVAALIGYATIIMQIDGRLAATNRVGIEIPSAPGERNTAGT